MIAERYLLSCHGIFVVCNIARAITDQGVQDVFELDKGGPLDKRQHRVHALRGTDSECHFIHCYEVY